jgi:CBS domain-containing protein
MQACEMMKTYIVKTTPDATLAEAMDVMDLYQETCLPVVDAEGRLVGVLTEHDVVCSVLPLRESVGEQARTQTVGDVMTTPAVAILESADMREAAEIMLARKLKRAPVVRDDGTVVGMLSRIDIVQAMLEGNL